MKEFLEALLKRRSLFIIIVGVVLLLVGVTREITFGTLSLQITDLLGKWVISIVGISIIVFGAFLAYKEAIIENHSLHLPPSTTEQKLTKSGERIIYDSSTNLDPFDFKGVEGQVWNNDEQKHIGPRGKGTLSIEKSSILNIKRSDIPGRYEIWLQRYIYDGIEMQHIPKDETVSGKRKVRIRCQAKAIGSEHTLDFVIKEEKSGSVPAHAKRKIVGNAWSTIDDLYFEVSPAKDYVIRIYDLEISDVPTSVQIQNLVITERVS